MSAVEQGDQFCDNLMLRVANGDREALGDLFASESGRLIAIARRILRRKELAEEAVQEGFIAAWKHAPQFDPARGSARAWLTTIVRTARSTCCATASACIWPAMTTWPGTAKATAAPTRLMRL